MSAHSIEPDVCAESLALHVSLHAASASCPQRSFIAIDGYYAAGKSTLAGALAGQLELIGRKSLTLSTDEFMHYSRGSRIGDYDKNFDRKAWYDLSKIQQLLATMVKESNEPLVLERLYNHQTGELDLVRTIDLSGVRVILLEGVFAIEASSLLSTVLNIVLVADPHTLLSRAVDRDFSERGIGESAVLSRYEMFNGWHFSEYLRYACPLAHIVLDTSGGKFFVPLATRGIGARILEDTRRSTSCDVE